MERSFLQEMGSSITPPTTSLHNMRIAVIGAGVSGVVCASSLAEKGVAVTVFESARGPGGRMSQRRERTEDGKDLCFDHGAPCFTVKDPGVRDLVHKWEAAGLVAEWKGPFGTFDAASGQFISQLEDSAKRYVGVPGMNSICKAICSQPGVETKFGLTVAKVEWRREGGIWDLRGLQGESMGHYDAVVASDKNLASSRFTAQTGLPPPLGHDDAAERDKPYTIPFEPEVPWLDDDTIRALDKESLHTYIEKTRDAYFRLKAHLDKIPLNGYNVRGSKILSWAACDSRKPGRSNNGSECWVLHSTAEYASHIISQTGLKKPSDDILNMVRRDLFNEFQKTVPHMPSPFFMKAHRWGSAFPTKNIGKDDKCLWLSNKRFAICGDFCVAPDVEGAILSGLAAASKFL